MTMTMTMKISLFGINHLNTMIGKNKAEKTVVNEQETIQNNKVCRYRRPTPKTISRIVYELSIFYIHTK